jgi:hypothetical protein
MASTQAVATHHEYRNLPLAALIESSTNPRKRFEEKSLGELAAYVSGHISRFLCRSTFCGRGRQTTHPNWWCPVSKGT